MKRKYIKPESVLTTCRLFNMVMASNQTEWHTGTDGQGDDEKIGGDQPDPNEDAKQQNEWESNQSYDKIYQPF